MWQVEYTKRFLKDLASLPENVQRKAEFIVFEELRDNQPFSLGYVRKMTGMRINIKSVSAVIGLVLPLIKPVIRLFASELLIGRIFIAFFHNSERSIELAMQLFHHW